MKLGLTLPQGCDREYLGMDARDGLATDRRGRPLGRGPRLRVALGLRPHAGRSAARGGADLRAVRRARGARRRDAPGPPRPPRARASYRNPGLTAKAISTIDVISGGRAILGIGAGWKEDEWLAYGYGFPPAGERLAVLADQLEIITRMLGPGRATCEGTHAHVRDAIHEPKGLQQPRIPILVGGNGPKVTWRLAARFADELNLDALTPGAGRGGAAGHRASGARRSGAIRRRSPCRSTSGARPAAVAPGAERRQRLRDYADLGLRRAIVQGFAVAKDPHAIDDVIDDAMAVGLLGEAVSPA